MLRLKHLLLGAAIGLLALLASPASVAQTVSVPATLRVGWIPPTATDSGLPLTGALCAHGLRGLHQQLADRRRHHGGAHAHAGRYRHHHHADADRAQRLDALRAVACGAQRREVRRCRLQATAPVNVGTKPEPRPPVEIQLTISVP